MSLLCGNFPSVAAGQEQLPEVPHQGQWQLVGPSVDMVAADQLLQRLRALTEIRTTGLQDFQHTEQWHLKVKAEISNRIICMKEMVKCSISENKQFSMTITMNQIE